MDQKNRRKNKMARQKTDITWTRDGFSPMNSTAFQFPIVMKQRKQILK